jgi:cysteine synthase
MKSLLSTRENLARTEGIMVGPTSGAVLYAARQVGANTSGRVTVISPDDATRYVSAYAKYLERG